MRKRTALLLAFLLVLSAAGASAQSLTGTIAGKVVDEQGGVLPGVTVTLTGKQGSLTTVTDETGQYRFVGLNPGIYEVKVELAGFAARTERNLDVGIGKTLEVPFTMKVGGLAESVEVVANASSIDTTSTAADNTLSQDLLQNMPINIGNFNTATALLDYAPGVNNGSAFGGDEDYGSALLIDGVDTRDPEAGSAWVFYNYNIIEEVQVGGVGAPAEYGGFTGAVVNTITKSGGNMFSGLFEYRFTNDSLAADNVPQEYIDLNPNLGEATVLTSLNDYTAQMGGPLVRDKAFWWFGFQRYAVDQDLAGPIKVRTERSPRYNGKITWNLTPTDTLVGSFQYDNYNQTGRSSGLSSSVLQSDQQTHLQDSPEAVWNIQYRKVFGSNTFLEAKYTGYWGYYNLDPLYPDDPWHYDVDGSVSGGAGYYGYYARDRNQVNVSVSTYAEKFGKHSFKFGVEIERSMSRNTSEYTSCGVASCYYYDYYGEPYLAYSGLNYDVEGRNRRESYYAQDQWKIGRLTASLGLRLDHISGYSPALDETVYSPGLGWGPRLGFAYDLLGKGTSVFRGSWGRYYEGAAFNPYNRAVSGYTDFISYEVLPNGTLSEFDRTLDFVVPVDSDISHYSLDETTIGFEQQLRRDMRFSATGMWRTWDNFIAPVNPPATWTPVAYNNRLTGQTMTLYRWFNRATTDQDYVIKNYAGFPYDNPTGTTLVTVDPTRTYKGLMLVLTKSYSNRWQGQFSYVWSKAEGSVGNTGRGGFTGYTFQNPNTTVVNTDGVMENDRTHEFKLMGGYQVPKIEVSVNAYYRGVSGGTYAAVASVSGSTMNWPGSASVFLEPRGSRRNEFDHRVDLRVEKVFKVDVHRFGIWMDVGNLFNADTVTAVQNRYPTRTILGNSIPFEAPTAIVSPRQLTFGGRWSF